MRVLVAFALAGCAAPPASSREMAVVGGFVQEGEDATVRLHVTTDSDHHCSGSLVAPRVVVTAKHCFGEFGLDGWTVGFGPTGEDRLVGVEDVLFTPDGGSVSWVDEDLAVAILADPIDDVPFHPLPWLGDDVTAGEIVRLIGYGTTNVGTFGVKNETSDPIRRIGDFEISTEGNGPCPGDSGGSVLDADGVLVGVINRAPEGCILPPPERISFHARVFAWIDLVTEAFVQTEACYPTAVEDCNGRDDDCDAIVDEGCAELGDDCSVDEDCLSGICADAHCAAPCADGPCPLGSRCIGGECRLEGPATLGDPCETDDECASLECVHWDDGSACADPCDEGAPCPEEYTCESGLCAPDLAVTGEPCRENGDCVRHVCGEFARGRFCTEICDAENPCPSGFECVATQDAVDVCARPAVLKERGDGCRAAPGGRFDLPALVVLGFALVRRRRP